MNIHYCLPIKNRSKNEVFEIIEKNVNQYHFFEVWLDTIEGIDNLFVNELVNTLNDKLILLFHRGELHSQGISSEKKLEILELVHNTEAFFDLDITETSELEYIENKQLHMNLVVSYHNYQETPVDLAEIVKQMDKIRPAIYKIATMCKNETDALKLLLLQQNLKAQNKKHIILGMGEFGTITRIYGTLWGNELIYAPETREEASAPGQLTKQELEKIVEVLVPNR